MGLPIYSRRALMLSRVLLVVGCNGAPGKPAGMRAFPECGVLSDCANTRLVP